MDPATSGNEQATVREDHVLAMHMHGDLLLPSGTSSSAGAWRRKACLACTKAKRQCSKHVPTCRRCRERGVECKYPMVRQVYAPLQGGSSPSQSTLAGTGASARGGGRGGGTGNEISSAGDLDVELDMGDAGLLSLTPDELANSADVQLPSLGTELVKATLGQVPSWFLSRESWTEQHLRPSADRDSIDDSSMKRYIEDVRRWLREWVSKGENPFIHRELYRNRMPECIQVAYMSLTAYLAKNEKNDEMTVRILGDRVAALIKNRGTTAGGGSGGGGGSNSADLYSLDTLDHLAQVQSLFVYLIIGLFDGNIRMRTQAEENMSVLYQWLDQMLEAAVRDMGGSEGHGATAMYLASLDPDPERLSWRLWTIAESVRRTWITGRTLSSVYLTRKQGWCECPGGLYVTARKGLWEAATAYSWSKAWQGRTPLFLQSMLYGYLFGSAKPSEVDDFGHALLSVTYGPEKMERWFGETEREYAESFDDLFLSGPIGEVN